MSATLLRRIKDDRRWFTYEEALQLPKGDRPAERVRIDMAHWIDATAEHKKLPMKLNADAIAYLVQEEKDGPTHVHFIGSNVTAGKPDLLVLESPKILVERIEKPR